MSQPLHPLTVGSLFAGIGGFDLAAERAGLRIAWQCEIDPAARAVLAHHFPGGPCYADVTRLHAADCTSVDVLCGGFPCQDVSVAGRRAGLAGERSGLWGEFARLIGELAPRWVLIENVPGLLSSHGGRDFATVLHGLVERGYGVAWRVLDAQHWGVPQRRRRVFLVGHLGDGRAADVLFERAGLPGGADAGRAARAGVAATLTGGATGGRSHGKPNGSDRRELVVAGALGASHGGADDNMAQAGQLIAGPLTAHHYRNDADQSSGGNQIAAAPAASAGHHGHSSPRGDGSDNLIGVVSRDSVPKTANGLVTDLRAGNPHISVVAFAWQQGDDSKHGADGRGRSWVARAGDYTGAVSSTRTDAVAGGFGVRRLTPMECERLQGFPDGWTAGLGLSDSARYRLLGNAVAVPVVEWLMKRIRAVGEEEAIP